MSCKGLTQVYHTECAFIGQIVLKGCSCPRHMSVGCVRKMVGNLRFVFNFKGLGRGSISGEDMGMGNPVAAPEVDGYCQGVWDKQTETMCIRGRFPCSQIK